MLPTSITYALNPWEPCRQGQEQEIMALVMVLYSKILCESHITSSAQMYSHTVNSRLSGIMGGSHLTDKQKHC